MPWKDQVKRRLERHGVRIQRLTAEERAALLGYNRRVPLPPGALDTLHPDNPRLRELERRYSACRSPMCEHSQWKSELHSDAVDLRYFRGDNAYLWQYSRSPQLNELRYFIYAKYVQEHVGRASLWDLLVEDGSFGCFTFDYDGLPTVSRDLLDSINELSFLDRHWGLFDRDAVRVLDVGAGYGRLAYRMAAAVPRLERYWCCDAIPRSTFLCEYYLGHRGVESATVVPIDEIDACDPDISADIAVSVHSFSEMSRAAIAGWLGWLRERNIPSLMIVPNERDQLLSREGDGSRLDCADLLTAAGYQLHVAEPTIQDPAVRNLLGVHDFFLLYDRK